ncbi:MAG: tetratricopeptide repeat protein, partial [Sphaerochaetaceae bacterium]
GDKNYLDENTAISPTEIFSRDIPDIGCQETELTLGVYDENGVLLLSYQKETPSINPLPESAKEAKPPKEILTNEELYLTAQHIEQYRHATYLPDPYYEEGLRRDNGDSRINNAYGVLLLRRGLFSQAEQHFRTAIERLTQLHPNPYDSEPFTNLGFALEYQGRYKEAYDAFFKATWSEAQAGVGYYKLASLATRSEEYGKALEFAKRALQYNSKNIRARNLVALLLFLQEKEVEAILYAKETLAENPFAYLSAFLLETHGCDLSFNLNERMENKETTFLSIAAELISYGQASLASVFLTMYQGDHVMIDYYRAYAAFLGGEDERSLLIKAREADVSCVFANTLFDQVVLQHAITQDAEDPVALYMLGNLCYDKLRYEEAYGYWKRSSEAKNSFATVHRNLALVLFNKKQDKAGARAQLEEAYRLDNSDARVFMELDQLYQKMGMSVKKRLENYQEHANLIIQRDDLMTCYVTLLNLDRQHEKSYAFLCSHKFHPWEGGEGRVSSQYVFALREMARSAMEKGDYEEALRLLDSSLRYPQNLGEGKLEGRKDNDIHYYKGCCYEQMGKEERARAEFSLATLGEMEPAGVMFYYDQPADMILYQGLACRKLGDEKGAAIRFNRLIDYGEAHYFDRMKVDYFAVSLPDMQLFEDDLDERNRIHCKFLLALGYYGKGEKGKAQELLSEVRKSNPTHMGAVLLLR